MSKPRHAIVLLIISHVWDVEDKKNWEQKYTMCWVVNKNCTTEFYFGPVIRHRWLTRVDVSVATFGRISRKIKKSP